MRENRILTELPIWEDGIYKGKTNWISTVGLMLHLYYEERMYTVYVVDYKDSRLWINHNGYVYKYGIGTDNFKRGKFGGILKLITNEFKCNIGDNFTDNKRDITITDTEYRVKEQKPDKLGRMYCKNEKWYKYTCNVCGWVEGWIEEHRLIEKQGGCACCANQTAVLGINTIWDTDRWMVDLGVSEEDAKKYTKGSNHNIEVTCRDCRKKKTIQMNRLCKERSIGCICGDGFSYPEKFMTDVLTQIGVEFEVQYSPNYLSNKKSDFYLPCLNLVIETDGKLGHNGGYVHGYSKKSIEDEVLIDRWKDEQHLKHGVETIRINCFESDMEYIKNNILKSKLNELFDLTKIDFVQADLFAIKSNKVKEVCDYWNQKEEWETTTTIACKNIWNIKGRNTIKNYLKKGVKLGWCEYNPKEESIKARIKKGKKVEVFKDDISLGVFDSCNELERHSEELFDTKLYSGTISSVANGKRMTHKGYTFKYIENDEIAS